MKTLLGGDVWLAPSLLEDRDSLSVLQGQFSGYDLFVCNLEAPCKTETPREGRRALLHTELDLLDKLNIGEVNVLLLGNNHMGDYGSEGVLCTVRECEARGFLVVGAGANLDEACKPVVVEVEQRRIAILSYSDTSAWVGAVAATETVPGVAPLQPKIVKKNINSIRRDVDDVWLFLHWGHEFVRVPHPQQRKLAKEFVSAGATLIIGHHQHVALGCEDIGNISVYYGLGNFLFPDIPLQDNTKLQWGAVERFSLAVTGIIKNNRWYFVPLTLQLDDNGAPVLVNSFLTRWKLKRLLRMCSFSLSSKGGYYLLSTLENARILLKKICNPKRLLGSIVWRLTTKTNSV